MGTGDSPVPVGDSPTGMTRGGLRKGLYLLLPSRAAVIPSGESPIGVNLSFFEFELPEGFSAGALED